MRYFALVLFGFAGLTSVATGQATTAPCVTLPVQAALTNPGNQPFHLKAAITDRDDPQHPTSVEVFWAGPSQWHREIKGPEFSQILVVNGARVFEQHSDDYFPLAINALVMAMLDPNSLLPTLQPDELRTNCVTSTSGVTCWDAVLPSGQTRHQCADSSQRIPLETLHPMGHKLNFSDYENFNGKSVARVLTISLQSGSLYKARITELSALEETHADLFRIDHPTPRKRQIFVMTRTEPELRERLKDKQVIMWPQVLDGRTTGKASYYVSIDRSGKVKETVVVRSDNERANDSARAQIERWRFKPVKYPHYSFWRRFANALKGREGGAPAQVEGVLNFSFNTRAWGPSSILSDAEARKLASNTVEPEFPAAAPRGATVSTMVAVDAEGKVIEMIPGDGPPGLFLQCMRAIKQWRFSPILEDGQPRPYRAQIDFRIR